MKSASNLDLDSIFIIHLDLEETKKMTPEKNSSIVCSLQALQHEKHRSEYGKKQAKYLDLDQYYINDDQKDLFCYF